MKSGICTNTHTHAIFRTHQTIVSRIRIRFFRDYSQYNIFIESNEAITAWKKGLDNFS